MTVSRYTTWRKLLDDRVLGSTIAASVLFLFLVWPVPVWYKGEAVPDAADNPGLVLDAEALLATRDTLAGTGTLNWSAGINIAAWDGIRLGGAPSRVTSLLLHNSQLTGTIPSELGKLSSLQVLSLHHNQLTGTIPPELGGLSNLQQLYLNNNQLTGTMPSELGKLSSLQRLSLHHNQLTGTIPPELGGLSNLQQLYLNNNQLTGAIPSELGSLQHLTSLWLSNNQLTGGIPSELGSLSNLVQVRMSLGNVFTGCMPTGLARMMMPDRSQLNLETCGGQRDGSSE